MNNAISVHASSTVVVGFKFPVVKWLIKWFILHIHFSERQTKHSNIQPGSLKEYSNPVRFKIFAIYESNIYFVSKRCHINEELQKLQDWRFSQRSS